MADNQSEQDKTEAATPFKLEEARKKGIVSKSTELNSTGGLLAGLLALAAFGSWSVHQLLLAERGLFHDLNRQLWDIPHLMAWLAQLSTKVLFILSPLLALALIGGVLANLVQTGLVFSATPLTPDFQRLNPAAGLKRMFSMRALFEALKSTIKFGIYSLIAYAALKAAIHRLPAMYHRAPGAQAAELGHELTRLLMYLVLGAIAIALVDVLYTRWEFGRRMRMSRRELKDEVKRREGDPLIRNKRREAQRELRKRAASAGKVKEADVLITNPEHFAVAVKYRRGEAPAPEVIAKGSGELALKMRQEAFRHRVPIVPNPRLARALFREVAIGKPIPPDHYAAVADVLRWVYELKNRRERGGRR